eukprot:CAMPEP_0178393682 /NCGR_PEP_ID=MMETSP0689_2-20121128/12312_1 /TAXON_ID=160604 /ORGANISM="Amphidinium massartii, Strain CS-259" /LENGTH=925 /DNA_ID=CAMNT_0020014279 /DNA_START=51 /DNA_END=2828 /DNA_ORIENTATION=-
MKSMEKAKNVAKQATSTLSRGRVAATRHNWVAEKQREKNRELARQRLLQEGAVHAQEGAAFTEAHDEDEVVDTGDVKKIERKQLEEAQRRAELQGKNVHDPIAVLMNDDEKGKKKRSDKKSKTRLPPLRKPRRGSIVNVAMNPLGDLKRRIDVTSFSQAEDVKKVVGGWKDISDVVVDHPIFEAITALVVAASTVVGAIEVDNHDKNPEFFNSFNLAVTFIFTFELLMRSLQKTRSTVLQPLYILDVMLVVFSWAHQIFVHWLKVLDEETYRWNMPCIFVLRLFRLLKLSLQSKYLNLEGVMEVLVTATSKSIQPLFFVVILISIFIFAMALMLVSLVPIVAEESEEVKAALVSNYRNVGRAALSLVEAMFGVGNWLLDVAMPLLASAERGSFAAGIFLVVLFLCIAMLHLGLTGLVTGVFLDHLFGASLDVQEQQEMAATDNRRQYLFDIELVWPTEEFPRDEMVDWPKLKKRVNVKDEHHAQDCADRLLVLAMEEKELKEVFDGVLQQKRSEGSKATGEEFRHGIFQQKRRDELKEICKSRMDKVFPEDVYENDQPVTWYQIEEQAHHFRYTDPGGRNVTLKDLYIEMETLKQAFDQAAGTPTLEGVDGKGQEGKTDKEANGRFWQGLKIMQKTGNKKLPVTGRTFRSALLHALMLEEDPEGVAEDYKTIISAVFPPTEREFAPKEVVVWENVVKKATKENLEKLDMSFQKLYQVHQHLVQKDDASRGKVRMEDFERALYNNKNYSSNVDMILVDDQQARCHQRVRDLEHKIVTRVSSAQTKLSMFLNRLQDMTKKLDEIGKKLDHFRKLEKDAARMVEEWDKVTQQTVKDETKLKKDASIEEDRSDVLLNQKLEQVEESLTRCDDLRARKPDGDISPRLRHEATEKVAQEIVAGFRDVLVDILRQDFAPPQNQNVKVGADDT